MRSFLFRLSALLMLVPGVIRAQVPDSDIWLADIQFRRDGLHIENPVNVTHRPGYDNQPAFLHHPVGAVNDRPWPRPGFLFTSADSTGSTDIFRWDPKTNSVVRVTRTPESEYSPTPIDDWRGTIGFYVVRVEADSTQRLWQFDIDGSNPRVFMAEVDSVGYFAWIDDTHIAAFVLGNEKKKEPHTLRVIDVTTQRETIVARGVGRSITRIPDSHDIAFTLQNDDETFRFMRLRHGRMSGEPLIATTGAGQDAAWMADGTMLMSAGTAIYASTTDPAGARRGWRQVADLAGRGISAVTRIVVSPDQRQLAFVATTPAP